jgi:hypothetical protein
MLLPELLLSPELDLSVLLEQYTVHKSCMADITDSSNSAIYDNLVCKLITGYQQLPARASYKDLNKTNLRLLSFRSPF